MKEPLVSVVITSMGKEYLVNAIKSVASQTYPNIEMIVVVDQNLEFDHDILKKVTVYSAAGAHNANVSRNIGVAKASGSYIALMDDDDVWTTDKIALQVHAALNHEKGQYYFSFGQTRFLKEGIVSDTTHPTIGIQHDQSILDYFFDGSNGFIQTSSFFGNRDLFLKNKFDESIIKHQDWDWLVNMERIPNVIIDFLPKVVTYYTVHKVGTSVGTKQRWKYTETWLKKHQNTMSNYAISNFYSKVILRSLLFDNELSFSEKNKEILRILKIISLKYPLLFIKSVAKVLIYWVKNLQQNMAHNTNN